MKRVIITCAVLAPALAATIAWRGGLLFSQAQPAASPAAAVSVRIRFGVTGTAPKPWDGSLEIENGRLVSLRNWHPRPNDAVTGSSWKLATRRGLPFQFRPWEEPRLTMASPYLLIPG